MPKPGKYFRLIIMKGNTEEGMDTDFSETALELFFQQILEVLTSHPEGITEYELMEELEDQHLPFLKNRKKGDLPLFRSHFLLFHVLYRLQDRLLREGSYRLSIFCLEIKLIPLASSSEDAPAAGDNGPLPDETDPMREYYLNLGNMEGVGEEEVRRMLRGFFRRLEAYYRQEEDLAVLGLPASATLKDVRKRYRLLAFQHHPDQGGDPEDFRRIEEAAGRLKNFFE